MVLQNYTEENFSLKKTQKTPPKTLKKEILPQLCCFGTCSFNENTTKYIPS